MYTAGSFLEIIEKFRKHMPDFNFTTDVIVGFPGETDADFSETARLSREAMFSHIHTFRYSRRKGTRADRMENQLEEKIKSERSEVIRKISEENRLRYMEFMLRKEQRVLIEKVDDKGLAHGYGEHYLPVQFKAAQAGKNMFQQVTLDSVNTSDSPTITGSTV